MAKKLICHVEGCGGTEFGYKREVNPQAQVDRFRLTHCKKCGVTFLSSNKTLAAENAYVGNLTEAAKKAAPKGSLCCSGCGGYRWKFNGRTRQPIYCLSCGKNYGGEPLPLEKTAKMIKEQEDGLERQRRARVAAGAEAQNRARRAAAKQRELGDETPAGDGGGSDGGGESSGAEGSGDAGAEGDGGGSSESGDGSGGTGDSTEGLKDKATIGGKTQEEACAVIKEEYGGKQPGHQAMGKIAKLLGVDKGNIRWNKDKKEIQGKSDDGKQVIVLATAPE